MGCVIGIVSKPIKNHGHFWLGIFDCNQILASDFLQWLQSEIMIGATVWLLQTYWSRILQVSEAGLTLL